MYGPSIKSTQQNDPPNTESFGSLVKENTQFLRDTAVSTILRGSFEFARNNLSLGEDNTRITLVIPDSSEETADSVWSVIETTFGRYFKVHAHKMTSVV